MNDIQKLSELHSTACLFIFPDKATNLHWIKQELDSFDVSEASDEDSAYVMLKSKSRCGGMPCAMHFDFTIGHGIFAKLVQAPIYGMCWFVSGLSQDNIEDMKKCIPNFDQDVVVIDEAVDS
jgi:hypothetical protein